MWPVPVNVRLNSFVANSLLDITATCSHEEIELDDYPEYADELTSQQKERIRFIAETLVKSFMTHVPIAGIAVVGHSDRALRKPVDERHTYEDEISKSRALNAHKALMDELRRTPGGGKVVGLVNMKPTWVGSRELKIQNATTEAAMRKNRRVVFKFSRCLMVVPPIIHPPLEMPHSLPNPADDPNTVFAGNHFKIRMISGTSAGAIGGACNYELQIWDIDNFRLAAYEYDAVMVAVGFPPYTATSQGEWSQTFTTPSFIAVDQFNAPATHEGWGAGSLGSMTLSIEQLFPNQRLPFLIDVPTGFSKGAGAESAIGGSLTIVRGSVRVFRGP